MKLKDIRAGHTLWQVVDFNDKNILLRLRCLSKVFKKDRYDVVKVLTSNGSEVLHYFNPYIPFIDIYPTRRKAERAAKNHWKNQRTPITEHDGQLFRKNVVRRMEFEATDFIITPNKTRMATIPREDEVISISDGTISGIYPDREISGHQKAGEAQEMLESATFSVKKIGNNLEFKKIPDTPLNLKPLNGLKRGELMMLSARPDPFHKSDLRSYFALKVAKEAVDKGRPYEYQFTESERLSMEMEKTLDSSYLEKMVKGLEEAKGKPPLIVLDSLSEISDSTPTNPTKDKEE